MDQVMADFFPEKGIGWGGETFGEQKKKAGRIPRMVGRTGGIMRKKRGHGPGRIKKICRETILVRPSCVSKGFKTRRERISLKIFAGKHGAGQRSQKVGIPGQKLETCHHPPWYRTALERSEDASVTKNRPGTEISRGWPGASFGGAESHVHPGRNGRPDKFV